MALFPVRSNPRWQPAAILENYSGIARFPCDSTSFLLLLADIAGKRFAHCDTLAFYGLLICHVRALCSNGRRYLYDFVATASCLSQIALKFSLRRSKPFSQILPQRDPSPVDLSVGDIRRQIAAEWLEIAAQWSQWRTYRTPTSFFQIVP